MLNRVIGYGIENAVMRWHIPVLSTHSNHSGCSTLNARFRIHRLVRASFLRAGNRCQQKNHRSERGGAQRAGEFRSCSEQSARHGLSPLRSLAARGHPAASSTLSSCCQPARPCPNIQVKRRIIRNAQRGKRIGVEGERLDELCGCPQRPAAWCSRTIRPRRPRQPGTPRCRRATHPGLALRRPRCPRPRHSDSQPAEAASCRAPSAPPPCPDARAPSTRHRLRSARARCGLRPYPHPRGRHSRWPRVSPDRSPKLSPRDVF